MIIGSIAATIAGVGFGIGYKVYSSNRDRKNNITKDDLTDVVINAIRGSTDIENNNYADMMEINLNFESVIDD